MESQPLDMPIDTPLAVRLASLFLRPPLIVLSSTMAIYGLLSVRDAPGLDGRSTASTVDGYFPWLRSALSLDLSPQVSARLVSTLQLLVAGLLLGLMLALLFGWVLRSKLLGGPIAVAGMFAASLHPIVVALTLLHWLAFEFRLFPVVAASSFSDDPAYALRSLVLPAFVVAAAIAPAMSTVIGRVRREDAPIGFAAMVASAADRSVSRVGWTVGFPFGTMLVALIVAETLFDRAGLVGLVLEAIGVLDARLFLDVTFVIALFAALVGFGVDLVSLRPVKRPAHLVGPQPGLFGSVFGASAAALCVIGLLTIGLLSDGEAGLRASVVDANLDPFSPGHILGTDQFGRDVFALFLAGLPRLLGGALLVGFVAAMGGTTVAAIWHLLGRGGAILGLLVDVAWWPGGLVLLAGFVVSSSWIWSVVLISVFLVPLAMRLAAREIRWTLRSGPWQLLGLIALVAAGALALLLLAEFFSPGSGEVATVGGLLQGDLIRAPMRTAAVGMAVTLIAFFLNLLGSSLVRIGWARVPRLGVAWPETSVAMAGPFADPTPTMSAREPFSLALRPPAETARATGLQPVPVMEIIGPDHAVWAPPTGAQQETPLGSSSVLGSLLADEDPADPTDPGVAPPAPVPPRSGDQTG